MANGQPVFILRTDNQPIPECRNTLAETALSIPEWTHALLIDDDVVIPEGGLKAMIDLNTDIAFIDYPMHYEGEKWGKVGTATYDEWIPGEDYLNKPVAWAGLGCCLVKREVFSFKPLFKELEVTFSRDNEGKISLNDDKRDFGGGGEDTHFMLEAKKLGFKIEPVRGLTAGHARLSRAVLALQEGKYRMQHKVTVNQFVERPFK